MLEPPEKYASEGDGERKAPLVEPPTRCQTDRPEDHRDGHKKSKGTGAATRRSHKLADTKDKTETMCGGDACTRRTGLTCRDGTTNHENDGHAPPPSVSLVPLLCVLCPALSCSLCAVLSSPHQRTMPSVPFYPTADEWSVSLEKDEIKKRGFADGFRPGATRP